MKRSIYAGLLLLTLATMTAIAAAPRTAADEPVVDAQGLQADGNNGTIETPPSAEALRALCPSRPTFDLGAELLPAPVLQPQVGQPCCATLCDQICGVGEPCLCKRCQVLGCGV